MAKVGNLAVHGWDSSDFEHLARGHHGVWAPCIAAGLRFGIQAVGRAHHTGVVTRLQLVVGGPDRNMPENSVFPTRRLLILGQKASSAGIRVLDLPPGSHCEGWSTGCHQVGRLPCIVPQIRWLCKRGSFQGFPALCTSKLVTTWSLAAVELLSF